MPGIFVAQLPQRGDLQESFDGRWAEPLYNILIREVRGLVPPYSRQRSIERGHFLHLQTPTMEHYTYNNGLMQAVMAVASCRPIPHSARRLPNSLNRNRVGANRDWRRKRV